MVQHKVKKTQTLPKGAKGKVKKEKKAAGPKRHHSAHIPAKKATAVAQDRVSAEVSKVINDKNEEMVRGRADTAQGRKPAPAK